MSDFPARDLKKALQKLESMNVPKELSDSSQAVKDAAKKLRDKL